MQFGRHQRWSGHFRIVAADFSGIAVGVPHDPDAYLRSEFGAYHALQERFSWHSSQRNLYAGLPRWNASYALANEDFCAVANRGHSLNTTKTNNKPDRLTGHQMPRKKGARRPLT